MQQGKGLPIQRSDKGSLIYRSKTIQLERIVAKLLYIIKLLLSSIFLKILLKAKKCDTII